MINPYAILGGALGGLLLLIGAYFYGRHDGHQIEVGAQAKIEAAVAAERAKHETAVDAGNIAGQGAEGARSTATKEIYREVQTVVDRPVYRNVCVDADGVRALDRAAAIGNGDGAGEPDGEAAPGAAPAIPARRDAGRAGGAGDAAGPV